MAAEDFSFESTSTRLDTLQRTLAEFMEHDARWKTTVSYDLKMLRDVLAHQNRSLAEVAAAVADAGVAVGELVLGVRQLIGQAGPELTDWVEWAKQHSEYPTRQPHEQEKET